MIDFNIEIQRQVIWAGLDDFSPNSMLPLLYGGQYGDSPELWRKAVLDLIRNLLLAGLISPLPGREEYQTKTVDELCDYLVHGDPKSGFDQKVMWDAMHFAGTRKLTELLEELKLASWEAWNGNLSAPLAEALSKLGIVRL